MHVIHTNTRTLQQKCLGPPKDQSAVVCRQSALNKECSRGEGQHDLQPPCSRAHDYSVNVNVAALSLSWEELGRAWLAGEPV